MVLWIRGRVRVPRVGVGVPRIHRMQVHLPLGSETTLVMVTVRVCIRARVRLEVSVKFRVKVKARFKVGIGV